MFSFKAEINIFTVWCGEHLRQQYYNRITHYSIFIFKKTTTSELSSELWIKKRTGQKWPWSDDSFWFSNWSSTVRLRVVPRRTSSGETEENLCLTSCHQQIRTWSGNYATVPWHVFDRFAELRVWGCGVASIFQLVGLRNPHGHMFLGSCRKAQMETLVLVPPQLNIYKHEGCCRGTSPGSCRG